MKQRYKNKLMNDIKRKKNILYDAKCELKFIQNQINENHDVDVLYEWDKMCNIIDINHTIKELEWDINVFEHDVDMIEHDINVISTPLPK